MFLSGLGCAESSLMALAGVQGIESDLMPRIATGLCGGMGRTCGACGALTGAVLAIGLAFGRRKPGDSPDTARSATRCLVEAFEAKFGARDCHLLLGCDLGTPEGMAVFEEKGLRDRCADFTRFATEEAVRIIDKVKKETH
ncbi:MAG: C_GCAxxG_C_C family protein [Synergistaceae bacterium]|nr:C_GCAxxG_C_C family protein [Synergistaceae bacterium]